MKKVGYIGLGKMGVNMALRLMEKGYSVIAFNRGEEGRLAARKKGLTVVESLHEVVTSLSKPRVVWLMVSSDGVDELLKKLVPLLSKGDMIVDGGNCLYTDTIRRAKRLTKRDIKFLDAGVSGGPKGARTGACVMVGGKSKDFQRLKKLFCAIAAEDALLHVGDHGAGHFVKMVHNGIEYGMMQALAEGFEVLEKSPLKLDLKKVAQLYNRRSVIESRLVEWLESAYAEYGQELKGISATVSHTGEGEWTIRTAKKLGVPVKVIEESLKFRILSAKKPRYAGKVLSALRNQFGGHSVK